jgi:hypothetical protein
VTVRRLGPFAGQPDQGSDPHYIVTGSVVLHVVASFGYYNVFSADRVGPEGLFVAFEPQTAMYQAAYLSIYHVSGCLSLS